MRIPLSSRLPPDDEITRKFKCAIGRFIYAFAEIERVMFMGLITTSQMPMATAKAVFTDAKIDKAKQQIKRLRKARELPDDAFLDATFNQLADITRLRNDIAHYGAIHDSEDKFKVSDELWKLEGARIYLIDESDIDHAILDLATIRQRLAFFMMSDWDSEPSDYDHARFPWRYKPSQPIRQPSSTQSMSAKRRNQRPSSDE